MKQAIKYKFAIDDTNTIIDISSIDKSHQNSSKYRCISCGKELIAKIGNKNQHHFAHKNAENISCNNETYLHNLAKLKIKEKFDKSDTFPSILYENVICSSSGYCEFSPGTNHCSQKREKIIDLKQYYDQCSIEKPIGDFKADLLLESQTKGIKPILIEVFVTHPCSEEKRKSGFPIIEIPIQSEEDIRNLETEIKLQGTIYNIPFKEIYEPLDVIFHFFKYALFASGKCIESFIDKENCKDINTIKFNNALLEISVYKGKLSAESFLLYARSLGYNIKHCTLCQRYYIEPTYTKSYPPCMRYKKDNTPIKLNLLYAYLCSYYQISKTLEDTYRSSVSESLIKIVKNDVETFNNINFRALYYQSIDKELKKCIKQLKQSFDHRNLRIQIGNEEINMNFYYDKCEYFQKPNDFVYYLKLSHSIYVNRTPLLIYCIEENYQYTVDGSTKAIVLKIRNVDSLKTFSSNYSITLRECEQSIYHNIKRKEDVFLEEVDDSIEYQFTQSYPYTNNIPLSYSHYSQEEQALSFIEKEFKTKNIYIERYRESPLGLKPLFNQCERCEIDGIKVLKIFNDTNEPHPVYIQPCLKSKFPKTNIPTIVITLDPYDIWKERTYQNCFLVKEAKNGDFYKIKHLFDMLS